MLIFSDNRAVRFILTADRQPSKQRARSVAKFSEFSGASIQHIEGKHNVMADFSSHPECDGDSSNGSDSDDCRIRNEIVRRVRISRGKRNPELLPTDPKLEDRVVWDLITQVRDKNCKHVEVVVMANHT